ncbi:hypothetical protein [Tenacibaculum agarivorans]|uniref:hypothetical protein n=1 Tax=Tenacibaculum agarivorans TaxID=1908389 RepID=UPI00094B9BE1|nr:hypothetical protein [Tenacibaculum agarivorans]
MNSKNNTEKGQNLSHFDADKRMENMAKLSKDPKDAFDIERLRQQHKEEINKNEKDRITARINHAMGERSGLKQEDVKETDQIYQNKNQQVTNKAHSQAKDIYQAKGNTASKVFAKSKLAGLLKHDFEINKNPQPEKDVIGISRDFNLSKIKGTLQYRFERNNYHDNYKGQNKIKEQDNKEIDMEKEL